MSENQQLTVSPTAQALPERECGIVMKGGITSGVVYPLAACELSKHYRFRRVGGASAGAIAAAATAAAEYGRRHGTGTGFARLAELPGWLGVPSRLRTGWFRRPWPNLFALFQPQRETRSLFGVLVAVLESQDSGPGRRATSLIAAFLRAAPLAALVGAVPGLFLAVALVQALGPGEPTWLGWVGLGLAVLLTLGGAVVCAALATVRRGLRTLPRNRYGICSGYHAPGEEPTAPPLTAWLTDLLNEVAGKPLVEPLTFGDLWGGPNVGPEGREIDLQMVTTCLSHGRPYRLPFEEGIFYFDPKELNHLFPPEVVAWMAGHPRPGVEAEIHGRVELGRLRPMPATADLPVVVAARMSLSFPLLISAVPLYAVDYRRPEDANGLRYPERCWFSDGGLSSNFPVHLFDEPLPRWPTFALNLRAFPVGRKRDPKDEAQNVTMPDTNSDGIQVDWQRWEEIAASACAPVGSVGGFLGAILNALQNWTDNVQLPVPGWRDRIAHVYLEPTEGGMNLNMPPPAIRSLSDRGAAAASLLASRYLRPPEAGKISWDNHRWVRFRSTMLMLQRMLRRMHARLGDRAAAGPDHALIDAARLRKVPSYDWQSDARRTAALDAVADLMDLVARWEKSGVTFEEEAPRPEPTLRIMPRV